MSLKKIMDLWPSEKLNETLAKASEMKIDHPVWDKSQYNPNSTNYDAAYAMQRKRYLIGLNEMDALHLSLHCPEDAFDRLTYMRKLEEGKALDDADKKIKDSFGVRASPGIERPHLSIVEKNYKPWVK